MDEIVHDPQAGMKFIEEFTQACQNLNLDVKIFSVENLYQTLLEKSKDRNSDEELIFQVFDYNRRVHEEVERKMLERKIPVSLAHIERFNLGPTYFDWDGSPIKQWEWSLKNGYFSKHVGQEVINGWLVSTVWMGLDHSFWKDNDPIIFETMIFKDDESLPDNELLTDYQERYSTLHAAEIGHEEACFLVQNLDQALQEMKNAKETT